MVAFADQCTALKLGDVLLVSHDMPVLSRITHAEPKSPYLALILTLDVDVARDLFRLMAEHAIPATSISSIRIGTADASLCAALVRYLESDSKSPQRYPYLASRLVIRRM